MIEVEANIAKGRRNNERWDIKVFVTTVKVILFICLTVFGIFIFKNAFPDQYDVIVFNNLMAGLLVLILFLGITLYTINAIFIFSQGTKRGKTILSDLGETFTHIMALIITVPLISATVYILLVGGNHSQELTFISGLLGVILGFYFGHRGVESAEKGRNEAMEKVEEGELDKEKEKAKREKEQEIKNVVEEQMNKLAEQLNYYKKKEAWDLFKEEVKKRTEGFKGVENIDRYLPWEEPEGSWKDEEKRLIKRFEEEWESYAMDKSDLEEEYEKPPV